MIAVFKSLSRAMAVLGGLVLVAVIVMTCTSILGRTLNTLLHSGFAQSAFGGLAAWALDAGIGPIRGDFELVEAMMAFVIFSFLPLTQMTAGHASVDVFTDWLPPRGHRVLRLVIEVLLAATLVIIAWQLKIGMDSKIRSGQTSFLLQFPEWWAFAASLVAASIAALTGVFMAGLRLAELMQGRALLDTGTGTNH